jgi:electron transfer flavoprotein alpha/beta subunit
MGQAKMTKAKTGAQYEIAIDGTTRTYRDTEKIAIEAAIRLKTKQPQSEITVRDVETGKVTPVKHPLQSR